jgi:hypothetical protein
MSGAAFAVFLLAAGGFGIGLVYRLAYERGRIDQVVDSKQKPLSVSGGDTTCETRDT